MELEKLLTILKNLKPILYEKFGIIEFAVFGSYVRGEEEKKSDIDIVILKIEKKDYFNRINAKYFLEEYLKRKVDIGYFDSIRPCIRKQIQKEMIYV